MNYLHQCGCNTEIAKIGLALSTKDSTFVDECVRMGVPVENEDWDVGLEEEVVYCCPTYANMLRDLKL